jgi:hypothetical protein
MNDLKWLHPSRVILLTCIAIATADAPSAAAEPTTAPHGATSMQEQQHRMDQLITDRTRRPAGIDPVAWATYGKTVLSKQSLSSSQ